MKLTQWKLYSYAYPLSELPLWMGSSPPSQKTRQGLLLELENQAGKKSWGEIVPLPGWSHETLEDVYQELLKIKEPCLNLLWDPATWLETLHTPTLSPSVSFGVQSAIRELLFPANPPPLPLNALLQGSPDKILLQAAQAQKQGFTTLKLKLDHSPLSYIPLIKELKKQFTLRIDCNRRYTFSEACRFFSSFEKDTFEYIEEPLKEIERLPDFPYPFALDESLRDESLRDYPLERFLSIPNCKALILKPTLQGGYSQCSSLISKAKQKGLKIILSSSFESPLGIRHIASFASYFNLALLPMGLDPIHYAPQDFLKPSFSLSKDKLYFPPHYSPNPLYLKPL